MSCERHTNWRVSKASFVYVENRFEKEINAYFVDFPCPSFQYKSMEKREYHTNSEHTCTHAQEKNQRQHREQMGFGSISLPLSISLSLGWHISTWSLWPRKIYDPYVDFERVESSNTCLLLAGSSLHTHTQTQLKNIYDMHYFYKHKPLK